ncbi:MAG: phosphomannomutase, partial [Gammaproteobacteria bacterium]
HQQGISISALAGELPERSTASNRLKNIPTELSNTKISELAKSLAAIETAFGWLCGKIKQTDKTDGLRITFENNEIIHLRPSGNSPELRCYNEASSVERAEVLNKACLAILRGWVGH